MTIELGNQPPLTREPHRSLFYRFLERIELTNLWKAIVETNKGKDLPYHNTEHLFGVAHIVRDLALAEGVSSEGAQMKSIICAALIHDVNHAGSGKATDAVNIANAIRWFDDYIARTPKNTREYDFYIMFGNRIREAIQVTEFPFVREPKDQIERLLRDADILYTHQIEVKRIIGRGLKEEVERGRGVAISDRDWFVAQVGFNKNVTMYTDAGRAVVEALKLNTLRALHGGK